jgi:catechol-2,3-dioxygenase
MKRFHIHVGVKDIESSVSFYSTLFGQKPTKLKSDYAKWMLEDPRLNFAISTHTNELGVDHVGIQVERPEDLQEVGERLKNAGLKTHGEGEATCCYATSNKVWTKDPSGVAWETYQTMSDAEVFHEKNETKTDDSSCCVPTESEGKCCG